MSAEGLHLDGVTVVFGGFRALNGLSLVVAPGELRAVIGPNGAGKTTVMDVITGKVRPYAGAVRFDGRDLTRLDQPAIARLGIGRTFPKPKVFDALTVFETLALALEAPRGPLARARRKLPAESMARLLETAERIGLVERLDAKAGLLGHGQKRWLEIGMLLAQDPRLLLVDEPVAGMTRAETERTAELLRGLAGGRRSVVVVAQDLAFVRALGVRVTVLHQGAVLSEGSLDHVRSDRRVVEAYLGR